MFPTEFSRLVFTVFVVDLFSTDMPLAGDELDTLRLLLTDEIDDDDADDEVDEEEFRLRRLVFELPVCLGLLLGRVSASFFFWSWSESSLSSLSWRSATTDIGEWAVVVLVVSKPSAG